MAPQVNPNYLSRWSFFLKLDLKFSFSNYIITKHGIYFKKDIRLLNFTRKIENPVLIRLQNGTQNVMKLSINTMPGHVNITQLCNMHVRIILNTFLK